MFIKKDERKIPQILADACAQSHDETLPNITELRLARRPAEFPSGSISVLTQPKYAFALHDLCSISLYDCGITSLDGIGYFAEEKEESERRGDDSDFSVRCSKLKELNVGRNPIVGLPKELVGLGGSLTSLWLDDCEIAGPLPDCLYELEKLEILRVSNNEVTSLKGGLAGVAKWRKMRVLCLDGNMIEEIPDEFTRLTHLESLLLRKNKLKSLPAGVPGPTHPNLTILHVSSNSLTSLPSSIAHCPSLKSIYANANNITDVPSGPMAQNLTRLENCNLSNNRIGKVDMGWLARFGDVDLTTGLCGKDSGCKVNLDQNPIVVEQRNALTPSSSPSKSKENRYGVSMDTD